jgi:hypothetical protein
MPFIDYIYTKPFQQPLFNKAMTNLYIITYQHHQPIIVEEDEVVVRSRHYVNQRFVDMVVYKED